MSNTVESAELVRETIADYVELFHSKADIEAAIKEDMGVMDYPYTLTWKLQPSFGSVDTYKLEVVVRIDGEYYYMEFYYWD